MGVKRKRKGTNGHKAQRPERRGEGTFSLPFELYLFGFSRHKFGQEPNLALQRADQKPILN
jgi:hypothetical protein